MLNPSVLELGQKRSTIRELFAFGQQRAAVVGTENIFDFSIGNPNVPAPDAIKQTIIELLNTEAPSQTHGYTAAQGVDFARTAIADDLNQRFGTHYDAQNLYLTVGAAAALSICFKTLTTSPDDEFIVLAPYFPEYLVFIEHGAGAKAVIIPARTVDFQIDFEALAQSISTHTRAVVVNSPNNPSGAVYAPDTIRQLAALLRQKSEEIGHPIFLISDEPYRELVYDSSTEVPFLPHYYDNTLVCYSYSKSLSLPGERIGYVLIPDTVPDFEQTYAAICGAGRVLGYVNAPSLFQRVVAQCSGLTADLSIYARNRDLLYEALTSYGYSCVKPKGAFYMFPQVPALDDYAFCERAKQRDLLVVPGTDFGAPGHIRISYCVQTETIARALPIFKQLAQ
ncbi:MAG: pyridoxal phosphate-dependent aminotransferase [Butyricicoccus pullicaecorum]|nr:pyridoxal phosphate-dependent aminotransferase [Butyricicoccus pullicaecorum]